MSLESHLESAAPYGVLVAAPARDEALFHHIQSDNFVDIGVAMVRHAAKTFAASPLPIGADLYWWNGELHRIATPGPEAFRYIRVPEFTEMLVRMEGDLAGQHGGIP